MTVPELVVLQPLEKTEINWNTAGSTDPEKEDSPPSYHHHHQGQRCGFACFSPSWIQDYATKNVFLVAFMALSVIQGMVFSYFTGTLSTLQKRFKINSETTGILLTGNELSQVLLSILVSYYGSKAHRTRWIAFGVLLNAISCYAIATAHIFYGSGKEALALTGEYSWTDVRSPANSHNGTRSTISSIPQHSFAHDLHPHIQSKVALCHRQEEALATVGMVTAGEEDEMSSTPLVLIFLSLFVHGIGGLFFWIFGGPYLDDNSKRTSIPVLFGFSSSLRLIGPTFGYLLASGSLKLYVNPVLTPTVTSEDPRWIGAWWFGWIVIGTLLLISSFVIALFPRKLRRKSIDEQSGDIGALEQQQLPRFSDIPGALWKLLQNKVYVSNNLVSIFYVLSAMGYWTYLPKYMETIFMQSAATASIVAGATGILSQATGLIMSGFLISKFQFTARQLAAWNVCTGFLHVVTLLYFIHLGCDGGDISFRAQNAHGGNLTLPCNAPCQCQTSKILPVCYPAGNVVFYSPCHAGCESYDEGTNSMSHCACLPSPTATVVPGNCSTGCTYVFLIFLAVNALVKFIDSTGRIGNMLVSYRCVELDERCLSIGLHSTLICAFALIPAPILYGKIIDSVCLVWGGGVGGQGNCMFYDGKELRYLFNSFAAALLFVAVIFDCSVWYFVKGLDLYKEPNSDPDVNHYEKETLLPSDE